MIILGSPFAFVPPSTLVIDQIDSLGLTGGLQLCLDAGDALSYTSGQTWADRSGNAYDFLRGSTSSAQSTDPTFNGVAGGSSSAEYWSFDGGDFFTLGQPNPTWVNNVHKNNAVVTLAAWVYVSALGDATFCGDYSGTTGSPMFNWYPNTSNGKLKFGVNDGTAGPLVIDAISAASVATAAWSFVAVALDEGANALTFQINGTQENQACTYSGPSSGSAGNVLKIGADGNGTFPMQNGSRIASFVAWSNKISDANLLAYYNLTKTKFGL